MPLQRSDLDDYFFSCFKSGDEAVFERIFKAHYHKIAGFCSQFTGDAETAGNIAQEAFINLWLNREKIDTLNGITSFLYTRAKSGFLNDIRHRKVINKYKERYFQAKEDQLNREVLESFDFNSLEYRELEGLIRQAVAKLPEKCRQVFMMSRFEGKKGQEIADELQIAVKSVEANMTRALGALRTDLSAYLPAILVQIIFTSVC